MAVDIFAGAPDPSQDDRTPGPWQVWNVEVEFTADRSNDYDTSRKFKLVFPRADPGTPEHDALMVLWALRDQRSLAAARAEGAGDSILW